jgi:hypothetical protein
MWLLIGELVGYQWYGFCVNISVTGSDKFCHIFWNKIARLSGWFNGYSHMVYTCLFQESCVDTV